MIAADTPIPIPAFAPVFSASYAAFETGIVDDDTTAPFSGMVFFLTELYVLTVKVELGWKTELYR